MSKCWILTLFLVASATSALAGQGEPHWSLPLHLVGESPNKTPAFLLCLTPRELWPPADKCQTSGWFFVEENPPNEVPVWASAICDFAVRYGTQTSSDRQWIVSYKGQRAEPLFRVDCQQNLAFEVVDVTSKKVDVVDASSPTLVGSTGPDLTQIDERLMAIDQRLATLSTLETLARAHTTLEQKIDDLRQDFLQQSNLEKTHRKSKREQKAEKMSCLRRDGSFGGRPEVMVSVDGTVLRFLEVRPSTGSVVIGLSEDQATEMMQQVQNATQEAILPRIFLSVPAETRDVREFYLQDRLIDDELYHRVTDGDAHRVSYREARSFVEDLNRACSGIARFALPTEAQFVVAAQMLYNPVVNGLKPCSALTRIGADLQLTELLGNFWQLTKSKCQAFAEDSVASCPERSYIRKGGTADSTNSLECVPEYRSAAPESVLQKDTSFRLVLAE